MMRQRKTETIYTSNNEGRGTSKELNTAEDNQGISDGRDRK